MSELATLAKLVWSDDRPIHDPGIDMARFPPPEYRMFDHVLSAIHGL
jgi:hypothetical protein